MIAIQVQLAEAAAYYLVPFVLWWGVSRFLQSTGAHLGQQFDEILPKPPTKV